MSDERLPWDKWFWDDWERDLELHQCSLAARGLWADCLAIMRKATPQGYLLIDGQQPTTRKLAKRVRASAGQVRRLLDELIQEGAASRTEDGIVYNRRMVRDAQRRAQDRDRQQRHRDTGRDSDRDTACDASRDTTSSPPPFPPHPPITPTSPSEAQKLRGSERAPAPPKERPTWQGRTFVWFQWMEDKFTDALKLAQREDFDLHEWRAIVDAEWAAAGVKPAPDETFKPLMARLIADVPLPQPTLKVRPVASQVPQYTTTVPDVEAAQRRRLRADYEAACERRVQAYLDALPAEDLARLRSDGERRFFAEHPEYRGRLAGEELERRVWAVVRRDEAIRSMAGVSAFAEWQATGVGV